MPVRCPEAHKVGLRFLRPSRVSRSGAGCILGSPDFFLQKVKVCGQQSHEVRVLNRLTVLVAVCGTLMERKKRQIPEKWASAVINKSTQISLDSFFLKDPKFFCVLLFPVFQKVINGLVQAFLHALLHDLFDVIHQPGRILLFLPFVFIAFS